jgi:hypothetical protein
MANKKSQPGAARQTATRAAAPSPAPEGYYPPPPERALAERDAIIATLQGQVADLSQRFGELAAHASSMEFLPPEDVPVFEVGPGGYYSADDVLYPEGVQVEDITGRMPLNEQLIPLNEPADRRIAKYLNSLPQHGTPNHEFVIEAAFRQLAQLQGMGDTPEARAAFGERVLMDAGQIKMKQLGLQPGDAGMRAPAAPAHRPGNVPLMSNTRIRHDASPLGHTAPPAPGRGPVQTRQRAPAAAPAHKVAPPMSTVRTDNLGRVGPGARAA